MEVETLLLCSTDLASLISLLSFELHLTALLCIGNLSRLFVSCLYVAPGLVILEIFLNKSNKGSDIFVVI